MPSTFFGLNIAKTGMATYNAWLSTTGHNISNVKTPGYSRQVVLQRATEPISYKTSYGMAGSGVEAYDIQSQRDIYYDTKFRQATSTYVKYDIASYYMKNIEDYLYAKDSSSGGITNTLDDFFRSLESLKGDSSNTTMRTQAIGYANSLTQYIQETSKNLMDLQEEVNTQISKAVDQINALAEQIASVNSQINTLEVYGSKANDLRDQRANLLDQLSEFVDIDVVEKEAEGNKGFAQFIVSVGTAVLVDSYTSNSIIYEAQDTYSKQNDADDLYKLTWSTGQDFSCRDTELGGKLQALFEIRDGNNREVFEGVVEETDTTELVVTGTNELATSLFKLDIPATNGVLKLDTTRVEYESFEVEIGEDGTYTYTFALKRELEADLDGKRVTIGDEVDFRGIPYYMSQLNEFIRKFSYEFNKVQTAGFDMGGALGTQMFIGEDKTFGKEMRFEDPDPDPDSDAYPYRFSSVVRIVDEDTGEPEMDEEGYVMASYYRLTALNTTIDSKIVKDAKLLACSSHDGTDATDPNDPSTDHGGISNADNLQKMIHLETDKTMFRQGQPGYFLQVMTSTVGVDSQRAGVAADNFENIKSSIDTRRLSKAGVDEDEEGQNLIICQNLLNYQYKVLSVMNEALDKLINGTAV